ncbi:GNAT family N-acetyltransferase [Rugosimonospora acidiphila]|uniref:GNAT family N-acetyltransferase n=1 Tax=Rugosimonospora acidiphila TaxID=556531 RepID=UPI0031E8ED9C
MLTVRPAMPRDALDIARINVTCWQRAYVGMVPDDVLTSMDVHTAESRYRRRLSAPGPHETLLATDGGVTAGYVYFGPYREGRRLDSTVGEIIGIYVDPAAWRTGAGRTLMTAALKRLSERGWDEVRLWVLEANDSARGFYARLGFRPDGATAGYPVRRVDGSAVELAEVRYTNGAG